MTIKQALAEIRAIGMKARYDSSTKEFRVNTPNGTEATAYYTDDRYDAIGTAKAMKDVS